MMTPTEYSRRFHQHVSAFFVGHEMHYQSYAEGPIQQALPGFHAIEVAPGPLLRLTAYISVGPGAADIRGQEQLEFITVAGEPSKRHVELLAMTAYYHSSGERLGVGHTFPIGEPWVTGSKLDHMLVSLPYPFGPKLEYLSTEHAKARILWLLPITKAELAYKKRAGLDALEERFDAVGLEYWRPDRESVV